MTKSAQIIEHVVVTFVEAGLAYVAINQTNLHGAPKVVVIGALGAGLSAVYNLLRQSQPTMTAPAVTPSEPSTVVPPHFNLQ